VNNVPGVPVRATAVGATAVGATAFGAFAVGALAIGAIAVGRLAIRRDQLTVRGLHLSSEVRDEVGKMGADAFRLR
jgi:hypothetical protein